MKKIALSCCLMMSSMANAFTLIEDIKVSSDPITVAISGYTDPVIIASVPTMNDAEAGVVSISNVTSHSFDVQFKEWPYLDGVHGEESVSFFVIEKGRHTLADGSVWEAGKFPMQKGSSHVFFKESFEHTPHVLLSAQSQNESDAFALRVSSASTQTFGVTLQEQEDGNEHGEESIGYLAVYSQDKRGPLDTDGLYYTLRQEAINQDGLSVEPGTLLIQEEQSKDPETAHLLELTSLLKIGNQLFAQDNTRYGADPMSLRYKAPVDYIIEPGEQTGEFGNIALLGTNGLTEASYSVKVKHRLHAPAAGFDGYNKGTLINSDSPGKVTQGMWVYTLPVENWLQVAFNQTAYITSFRVVQYKAASDPGMGPKDVILQVSYDNQTFTDHEAFTLEKSLDQTIQLSKPAVGKYIRLKVNSTQGHDYIVIGELEYYGGFVKGEITDPVEPPAPSLGTTCETIKAANPSASSGLYQVDPDGQGGNDAFDAYCDMDRQGGGWMLVANHKDGLDTLNSVTPLLPGTVGVVGATQWQSARDNMTTGMMFVDEHQRVSTISKAKLNNGNCVSPGQVADLTSPAQPYDTYVLWQDESNGCSLSGLDYSYIALGTKYGSRGEDYLISGASLFQFNVKFDVWPYADERFSAQEQNALLYYIK
ncbi:discoidin domain-containing protein [Pseudoalteromonas viridis]|uniref:Discoidin domain-containing protein n=1 Tax=Pseudoalteromonas viridis TaxID=339617 RepID=A0ABX7VAM7_9GAMM|nr:discoidin domain-containing protein [Pseudoalteromonas viridis]QTL37525.1 discoidin domain-containing protein [Pseudoalteromonas viridis]